MAISMGQRRTAVVRALFVLSLLYLSSLGWRLGRDTAVNLPLSWISKEPNPQDTFENESTNFKLVKDAHKLLDPDSFQSHFAAVRRMRGVTMADAKSGCTWAAKDEVNYQYSSDTEWAVKDRNDTELENRRTEWHEFVANGMLSYSLYKNRFRGRGIVIVAGNGDSLKRVRVILRALKKLESKMPVEIHYWDGEMTEQNQSDMSSLWPEMYFNDLSSPANILKSNHDNFFHINYQLKTAAVINSRFAEPLLLDSDNIPVVDPASLYESEIYKEYGTLFWPDIARTRPNNPMWAITNTECRMNEYEQESGQLIIDKRRYFYHLQLAVWFNNGPAMNYYSEFLLGDKDMFRFAWHALKTKYGSPSKWLTSVGTLSDNYYCGHSFAQHHPDGHVAFLHGGLVKTMAKQVMKWQRKSRGGIFQVYKTSEYNEQHQINVNVSIKFDSASYLPQKPAELQMGMCTDIYKAPARPLEEIVPNFEKTFEEIGGYWMLDD